MKNTLAVSILACLTGSFASAQVLAKNQVRHILLISVDGMTELDYQLWVKNNPTSAIGQLATQGLHYTNAYGTKPGDSIPATVGIFTVVDEAWPLASKPLTKSEPWAIA